MPEPVSNKTSFHRDPVLAGALLLSLLLHGLVFLVMLGRDEGRKRNDEGRVVMVAPVKMKENTTKPPENARFTSDRNHIARKETSVPLENQNLVPKPGAEAKNSLENQGKNQQSKPRVPRRRRPRKRKRRPRKEAEVRRPYTLPVKDEADSPVPQEPGEEPPVPQVPGSQKGQDVVKLLEQGVPVTGEHIPEVGTGSITDVTTRQGRGGDFFLKVKQMVAKHWHPDWVYRKYDPDGTIYGENSWMTVLQVELDAQGNLVRVWVHAPCGLDFLDDEALRAMRAAAPFPTPPKELIDPRTGRVRFRFGFILRVEQEKIFDNLRLMPP